MEHIVLCTSVRSRKRPYEKCENPATHGNFCGIHYKNPSIWRPKKVIVPIEHVPSVTKLQQWYRTIRGLFFYRRHGPGYWDRTSLTNDTDFFSTDPIQDLSGLLFISYKDEQNHVYGFDIRSLNTLYTRASQMGEPPQNPYTRRTIPPSLDARRNRIMAVLAKSGMQTEWIPIQPHTPEQQWRMKVVDLFHTIDNLNYYSSPDWFINLTLHGQIRFYRELYDIWNYRAGLSQDQKQSIVPNHTQRLFRYVPYSVASQNIHVVQKINMNTIRMLITSAEDRNDRILGAMYVITTFTIVNRQARIAYPWLYESVMFEDDTIPIEHFGMQLLHNLLMESMPPLQLDNGNATS